MEQTNELERALGRLEGKMDALVASVNALAASFESLEKGRLSRLEISFATLQTEVKDKSRSTSFWTSAIVSLIVTVLASLLVFYFTKT